MVKVFTTGTFDILHYGHINLLKRAKEMGDFLRVGLNVYKNGQPTYYSYEERAEMLKAIKYVDEVVPIREQKDKFQYMTDIFVIGSDYKGYDDISEIEKYSKVVFLERTPNISTTKIKIDHKKYNRIIVDLDNTLCVVENRDFKNAKPIQEVIDKVNEYHAKGYEVIVSTARGQNSCKVPYEMQKKYYELSKQWLDNHNVKYDYLDIGYKQNADLYIDDKAINVEDFIYKRVL